MLTVHAACNRLTISVMLTPHVACDGTNFFDDADGACWATVIQLAYFFANVGERVAMIDLAKQLDLPGLLKCAVTFSTGQWHPGFRRFLTDMQPLADSLSLEAQALPGVCLAPLFLSLCLRLPLSLSLSPLSLFLSLPYLPLCVCVYVCVCARASWVRCLAPWSHLALPHVPRL
jgi:hypothetical protein